jgi:hypothetical protein
MVGNAAAIRAVCYASARRFICRVLIGIRLNFALQVELIMLGTFFLAQAASNAAIQTTYADSAEVTAVCVYLLIAAQGGLD